MANTKLIKRMLSVFLAMLMVLTSLPLSVFARDTGLAEQDPYWTRVASSNFDSTTGVNNATANKLYNLNQSPVMKSGDSAMTWGLCDYANASSSDGSGLYVDDGYIVLTGYNGNTTTPVTGKANFKIDVELEWTAENANANSQRYCTLQLANGTALGKTTATMGSSANNIIAQDYYGKVYVGTTAYGNEGTSYCISPYSANLTTNKKYHYIMTYANKTLKTYVTDENYTVMQDVCTVENVNIDTNAINSICLGDDDKSYYFHNTKYHSITFYEGKTTSVKPVDTVNSKYLFAYFTGNASNDESLHLAVSTDGMQWKTLNKNYPVWNGTAATDVYPNNNGSVAATTHIRDPYIMRAEDGSYYVFATDLDTQGGTNWGNNSKMHVFKVNSIADFKDGTVEHWDIDMQDTMSSVLGGNTIRTWAPQAIYDPEYGQYMLYWSAATDSYGTTSMYYVYTTDFKSFTTTPKRLISPIGAGDNGDLNQANIDGDIYYNGQFYYLWFKNEATSSLAVMTSESPSGPYTNLKAFSYSQALEGPQIYQLQNGKYVLLADAYNNYHYRAFVSDTVDGFTADKEDNNTNIDSLQPRHGAVIQIDDAEYNALVNKFGIDADDGVIRYEFSLDHHNESDGYTGKTWEGNQYNYDVGYKNDSNSYADMGNGKAKLVGKNLFINDTNVREVIRNSTFTFSFKFKLTQKVATNPVIFATCSSASANTDYVRLLQDGTFTVNGKDCTENANIVLGEEHTYTIAYSGVDETAILLQDGNLVGAIPTGVMNNTGAMFVGLGFSDFMSGEGRIYGEYSELTFQKTIPDVVKAKLEENIVDESATKIAEAKGNLTSDDVNNKSVETFNKPSYYFDATATDTYQNVIYSSSGDNMKYVYGTKGWATHYFYYPNYIVNVYDGQSTPSFGVVYKVNSTDRSSWTNRINCQDDIYSINQKFKGGSTDSIYSNFKDGTDTIGFTKKDDPSIELKKNNTYYYWSKYEYNGTGNSTDYYDYRSSHSIYYHMSAYLKLDQEETVSGEANHYVLNYKPLRDIVSGDATASPTWGGDYKFKDLYNEIQQNGDRAYTTESIVKYYEAVNEIVKVDINNSFIGANDTNVADKVTAVAGQIKKAVEDYNAAVEGLTRQYKVTFKKASVEGGDIISIKYVSTKDNLSAEAIKTIAPPNSAAWYDTEKHYTYNWNSITNVTGDVEFSENRADTEHTYTATTEADNPSESAEDQTQRYKASTCTEAGFYYNVCSCGYEYLVNTNPLGHDYQSTVGSADSSLYKAPTCTDDGFHKMICSRGDDTYTVIDGALDHDWGTPVSNGDGTHKQTCSRDNSHTQDLPCTMVENAEGTEATCSECGYKTTIVKLDRTAYNEALANANAVLENEKARYSADSLSALQAVLVQAGKDALAATTQEELNDVTATIVSANSTDTVNGGVLVPNTFRITYGNMFSFDDFMKSDSKDCATDNGIEKGTIGFDFDNQVFTVTSNENYSDVYSAFGGAGTYKIPVSDSKSYTFEFTAKGALKNQVHVFFYNENGTALEVGENYTYLYNGAEQTTKSTDYFVCKYDTRDGETTKLTFTPPKGTVRVDVRFGVTTTSTSCSFYNIGFYETAMVKKLVLADGVVYGTAFDEVAIRQPEIDGMHFGGWFVDKELKTSASTLTEITRNVNIYAKLDAYKVKDVVGCTLLKHGYTTYVCSDENCTTDVVYTSYDDQILDGKTNGYWDAYNNLVALVTAEEGNGYANYTEDSVNAVKDAYTTLHATACGYYNQSDVDTAAEQMKTIINQLVVKVNFVTKTDGAVEQTNTVEVPYNSSFTAPTVNSYNTVDGRYTWTFTSWDREVVTSNVTTGATYVAQYAKTDNIDLTAYNAAVQLAQSEINNTAKYTLDSRNELQRIVDGCVINEDTTQQQVNAYVTELETKTQVGNGGVLVLESYSVTFRYFVDGESNTVNISGPTNYAYGYVLNLNTSGIPEKTFPYKWTYSFDEQSADVPFAKATNTASVVVKSDLIVTVFLAKDEEQTEESSTVRVNLYDKSKRLIGVAYTTSKTITFTDTEVNAGGTTLTPTRMPFYNAKGFIIDGTIYSSSKATYDIPEGIKLVDVYTNYEAESKIQINISQTTGVTLNNKTGVGVYEATWNEMITLKSETEVDWYANGILVAKGTIYPFRANANVVITTQIAQENVTPSTSIGYFAYDVTLNRVSVVNNFYAPNAQEAGVILSTKYSTVDDVKKYGQKFGVTSENFTNDKNQVRISVSRKATTSFKMYAVSYVVAEDGQTYYSDVVSVCEYNA